jgi:hypothetical protein
MASMIRNGRRLTVLGAIGVLVVACGGGSSGTAGPGGATSAPAPGATTGSAGGDTTPAPAGERSFYAFDAVNGGVILVDPDGGDFSVVASVDSGTPYSMAAGDGAIWLGLDSGDLVKVDVGSGSTTPVSTGISDGVAAVAVGEGSVWSLHGGAGLPTVLARIDPASGTVATKIPSPDGTSFYDLAVGEGSAWMYGNSPTMATTLYEVDPSSGELIDREVSMVIDSITTGEGSVWLGGTIFPDGATTGVPGVGRFDPSSGTLTTIEVPSEPGAMAVGADGVWAAAGLAPDGLELYRIDPATNTVTATIPLGDADSGLLRMTTGAGFVWITTSEASYAVDPSDDTLAGQADAPGSLGLVFP